MSERAARYGDPRKLPPLGPEPERPDNRVLREYLEERARLEESKSSGTASTPTFEPEATSPSPVSKPGPYTTPDE